MFWMLLISLFVLTPLYVFSVCHWPGAGSGVNACSVSRLVTQAPVTSSSQSHNISQPRSLPPTDTDTHFSWSQEAKLGPRFCLSSRQKIDRLKREMFVHGQIIMLTIVSGPAAYAGHSTGLPGRHQTVGSCPAPATGGHCPHMPPAHCSWCRIVNIWCPINIILINTLSDSKICSSVSRQKICEHYQRLWRRLV